MNDIYLLTVDSRRLMRDEDDESEKKPHETQRRQAITILCWEIIVHTRTGQLTLLLLQQFELFQF